MAKRFLLLLIVFGILLSVSGQAVSYRFTHLGTSDGIANNSITDITQDSKGYMWFATLNGLQRYDGYRFNNYHFEFGNERSLPSDVVAKILEDDKGNIWAACNNGVAIINQVRQKPKRVPFETKAALQLEVTQFFQDSKKNIWLTSRPNGAFIYDNKTRRFIEANKVLPPFNWTIFFVGEEQSTGNYWFGCDSGLAYYDVKRQQVYTRNNNPANIKILNEEKVYKVYVTGLFIDQDDKLWFNVYWSDYPYASNSYYANYNYDTKTKKVEKYNSPYIINHLYSTDKHNNIWLVGGGMLAERQADKFVQIYSRKEDAFGLKAGNFSCLYEDAQHNNWIGTDEGIFIFNRERERLNRVMPFDKEGNPVTAEVTYFLERDDGKIWVSTWGSGIYEYDNQFKPIKQYPFADPFKDNFRLIWCMHKAKDGRIWIGCQAGRIMIYDPKTGKFTKLNPPAFDLRTVRTIDEDQQGNIWFGTQHGYLIKYIASSKQLVRFYPAVKKNAFGNIHQLHIDKNNNLWACTALGGLVKVNVTTGQVIKQYKQVDNDPASLSGNSVTGLVEYSDSIMMVASLGVNILNTKTGKYTHINTRDGLPSNAIVSLQRDKLGNLWTTMSGAISKISWPSQKIEVYKKEDGVLNDAFQVNGIQLFKDGRIAAATSKDFIYFNPKKLRSNQSPPDVKITGLQIFDEELNADSVLTLNDKLRLSYEQSFLTIQFSSLTYLTDKFTYYYKLEGLDKDWIKTNNLSASYNHLAGGNYTFHVKCENGDGMQSKNISSLKIYIRPPFWETWWFFFLLAAGTTGFLYFIHRLRINRLVDMQQVRTRIARDLHDDMGSTLSTINILSEMAKMKIDKDTTVTKDYLAKISDNSSRMMEAMDDIVWSINPMNDNMQKITARMREYATNLFEAKDIEYTFQVDEGVKHITLDMEARRDFFLVFKEAVNNLAKYSKCQHAKIKIETYEYTMLMKIQDDGIGFDVKNADNGNGLANMQKRAQSLNGILTIKSKPNFGTKVVLEVKYA